MVKAMTHEELKQAAQTYAFALDPGVVVSLDGAPPRWKVTVIRDATGLGFSAFVSGATREAVEQAVDDAYQMIRLRERLDNPAKVVVEQKPDGYTKYRDDEGEFCGLVSRP
jgi:hypothetical protein